MKYIKLVSKGACRLVSINDSARLNSFIQNGWEPARDNGKIIIRELDVVNDNKVNVIPETADLLDEISKAISEETI